MPIPKRSTSPRADIDTAAVDSLKVLDPKRPIREAGIQIAAVTLAQSAPVTLFGSKSRFVRH